MSVCQTIAFLNPQADKRLDPVSFEAMASAIAKSLDKDFAPVWGQRAQVSVSTESAQDLSRRGVWPCQFLPTLEDEEALAYHTEGVEGVPLLFVGLDAILNNGGTLLTGDISASAAADHECKEGLVNPFVDTWCDYNGTTEVCREVSDPTQGDTYQVDGVSLSNFVTPDWFNPEAPASAQLDFAGKLQTPFEVAPGGYVALRRGGPAGTETQVFGQLVPAWKKTYVMAWGRRSRKKFHELRKKVR